MDCFEALLRLLLHHVAKGDKPIASKATSPTPIPTPMPTLNRLINHVRKFSEEPADDDVETEDAETGTDVVVLSGGIADANKPFLNSVITSHVVGSCHCRQGSVEHRHSSLLKPIGFGNPTLSNL